MPRPKIQKRLSVTTASIPVQLAPKVRDEILEILNLDDEDTSKDKRKRIIQKIESLLTAYPATLVFYDKSPRPAAKLIEINSLLSSVKAASATLEELTDDAKGDIGKAYVRGIPQEDPRWPTLAKETNEIHLRRVWRITKDLKEFIPQLEQAHQYLKTCSSQHGTIKQARNLLTAQLNWAFDESFHTSLDDTNTRELKMEFVQTVFKAYNKLNVVPDKLPTDKRSIRSLLGPDSTCPK